MKLPQSKTLAMFDLDHTLIPIDSDYAWGEFLCNVGAVDETIFRARNHIFYEQYQAGTLDATAYLIFIFETLAQFSAAELKKLQKQFMKEIIAPAILPKACGLLDAHKNDLRVIITATNAFVTEPIAQLLGIPHLIAAQPEYHVDGRLTGKIIGSPTLGPGKIKNLALWLTHHQLRWDDFDQHYFYTDSHNDLPLLAEVNHPVATNPDPILLTHAQQKGWPILYLFND